MSKRAVDLSLEELEAMGANAALAAANKAADAGLKVVGVAEVRQSDRAGPALMQRRPSGLVTPVEEAGNEASVGITSASDMAKRADD